MTPLPSSGVSQTGNAHILEALADLFVGASRPSPATLDDLANHLATCRECRTGLALLLDAQSQREDLSAAAREAFVTFLDQLIPLVHGTALADPETLAAYAETVSTKGDAGARRRFPFLAAHLDRCPDCRETVASVSDLTVEQMPTAASAAATLAPAEEPPIWLPIEQGMLRLRERLTVLVGQLSVAVTGALPGIQTLDGPAPAALGLTRGARGDIRREERLIFTLRTPGSVAPWLRLSVDLSARLDRQLLVNLGGEAVVAASDAPPDADMPGDPWAGLTWRADLLDGQSRRLVGQGATDAAGHASFPMPTAGTYELTVSAGAQSWQIPFDVRH